MSEEVYVKQEADELTNRIADRLGERQQKLERMAEWEHTSHKSKVRPIYWIGAAAACVAVLLLMMPFWKTTNAWDDLGLDVPSMTEYRAAIPEISSIMQMIDDKDYSSALEKTRQALERSDWMVEATEELVAGWDDEEMIYELEQEVVKNSEIRWTYIYLLVKTGKKREAKKQLKRYIKSDPYCEHLEEAQTLLNAL